MRVNDVLENAAIEVVSTLPATVAVGRILLLSTNSKMYVGNSSKKPVVMGHAVGEIRTAMLTLAQFQAEFDDTWVLANGAGAAGTDYNTITSQANIPDLRGRFLRGKNNGLTGSDSDPNGDLTLGAKHSYRTGNPAVGFSAVISSNGTHSHVQNMNNGSSGSGNHSVEGAGGSQGQGYWPTNISGDSAANNRILTATTPNHNHTLSGLSFDTETAPAYTVVNYFIKINR